jgi:hypothetical protein
MVFMEANNDLDVFAPRNLKQMKSIGSNENVNIVAYIHSRENNVKTAKTLFIKKKEAILLKEQTTSNNNLNTKNSLISFCVETIKNYPAEKYALIFWDHGTGAIEPLTRSVFPAAHLFELPSSKKWSRSQHFMPFLNSVVLKEGSQQQKGVCFDDSSGHFLPQKKLREALASITKMALRGGKFDLVGFDACLMSMVEIASSVQEYAEVMVGSQEVELGTGWNYARVLAPFLFGTISAKTLGIHIVNSYAKSYEKTEDFTQSAIDLMAFKKLESNISTVAQHLKEALAQQTNGSVKAALRYSRNKHLCTHFDEPDFIDLHHFYQNLILNLCEITLTKDQDLLVPLLKEELIKGCKLIKEEVVIANKSGPDLPHAAGLSIYFPEYSIHSSYRKNIFARNNADWIYLLAHYLSYY